MWRLPSAPTSVARVAAAAVAASSSATLRAPARALASRPMQHGVRLLGAGVAPLATTRRWNSTIGSGPPEPPAGGGSGGKDGGGDGEAPGLMCPKCLKSRTMRRTKHNSRTFYICSECNYFSFVYEEQTEGATGTKQDMKEQFAWTPDTPKPREVSKMLSDFIIGQDYAKTALAVAVYNHFKRVSANLEETTSEAAHGVLHDKSNILMCGPTGCGKTLMAKTLAKIMDVPIVIADCTTLTQAGYVGDDVETVVYKLVQAAGGDIDRAQRGIIFLDEVDKISGLSSRSMATRDVSGEGVQQSLLKLLEGTTVMVPEKSGRRSVKSAVEGQPVDTSNILFIASGAFNDLEQFVLDRQLPSSLGFGATVRAREQPKDGKYLRDVTPQDLGKFGLIPEFVGRFPCIVPLEALTESDLVRVLTEPKNSLVSQYKSLFALEGAELEFDEGALNAIASEALKRGTGARGLRSIIEKLLLYAMLDVPGSEPCRVRITAEVVSGEAEIVYEPLPPPPQPEAAAGDGSAAAAEGEAEAEAAGGGDDDDDDEQRLAARSA